MSVRVSCESDVMEEYIMTGSGGRLIQAWSKEER